MKSCCQKCFFSFFLYVKYVNKPNLFVWLQNLPQIHTHSLASALHLGPTACCRRAVVSVHLFSFFISVSFFLLLLFFFYFLSRNLRRKCWSSKFHFHLQTGDVPLTINTVESRTEMHPTIIVYLPESNTILSNLLPELWSYRFLLLCYSNVLWKEFLGGNVRKL